MSTATLNLFYASEDFKNFEDEYVDGVGTNSAKLGDRYKGLLVDQLTLLENYLVDILHFKIIIANILMSFFLCHKRSRTYTTDRAFGLFLLHRKALV